MQTGVAFGAGCCGLLDGLGGNAESSGLSFTGRLSAAGVVGGVAEGRSTGTAGGLMGRGLLGVGLL